MDTTILSLAGEFGYLVAFGAIALESMGLPVPGESAVIVTAVLATRGYLPLWGVAIAAFLGSVIGGNTGYWLGRHAWRRLLIGAMRRWTLVTPEDVIGAERFFERPTGWLVVCFGRFVAALRIASAPLAGITRMPARSFVSANLVGSAAWTACLVGLAVVIRADVGKAVADVGWLSLAGVPVTVLLVAWYVGVNRRAIGRFGPQR